MENVTSADGTSIAYSRSGRGPALVLVVGAFCDRETTSALSPLLGSSFTVFEYDRRGRGASTDTPPYAVGREVEDLRAVIEAAGGSAFAYGHSSGAILVLEAVTRGVPISEAAVYEPPYTVDRNGDGASDQLLEDIQAALTRGDRDRAAELFLEGVGTPPEYVAMIRNSPGWPRMRALAPTLPYDLILSNGGAMPTDRLAQIAVPVLAMAGGASFPWAVPVAQTLAEVVPNGRARTLDRQSHGVDDGAVADALIDFFLPE